MISRLFVKKRKTNTKIHSQCQWLFFYISEYFEKLRLRSSLIYSCYVYSHTIHAKVLNTFLIFIVFFFLSVYLLHVSMYIAVYYSRMSWRGWCKV